MELTHLRELLEKSRAEGYTGPLPAHFRLTVTVDGFSARRAATLLRAAALHAEGARARALDEVWKRLYDLDDGENVVSFSNADGCETLDVLVDYATTRPESPFVGACLSVGASMAKAFAAAEAEARGQ